MKQIKKYNNSGIVRVRVATLRQLFLRGIKWWAEHQAWPATDEIRVDRHRSTCG